MLYWLKVQYNPNLVLSLFGNMQQLTPQRPPQLTAQQTEQPMPFQPNPQPAQDTGSQRVQPMPPYNLTCLTGTRFFLGQKVTCMWFIESL